jgi:hypothetical protein
LSGMTLKLAGAELIPIIHRSEKALGSKSSTLEGIPPHCDKKGGYKMAEPKDGCVTPARGPLLQPESQSSAQTSTVKEVPKMQAQVGKPAPDFEVSAFIDGGFKNIKLSDYKGKWVALCFYPGDFTFV